jgi:predicted acyltransferase
MLYKEIMSAGTAPQERLISLDVFRGLTIAAMIIVNNPGSWQHVYPPLQHAEWHGWTPTDLIFPFFLFIVGISISLALSRRKLQGNGEGRLYLKIVRRSLILFGLGLFLALFPRFDFTNLRIPGVLQRIALCYLLASVLFLKSGWKLRAGVGFGLLSGYWLLLKYISVPGYGAGIWEYAGNLCGYLDSRLLSGHLYKPEFDPEGLLSTLPALATTLLGTLAGDFLRRKLSCRTTLLGCVGGGIVFTVLGLWSHSYFPINKQLWTSSYVLLTAGLALLCFSACYAVIDGAGIKKWALPFQVFGTNAILVFVGSGLMARMLGLIQVTSPQGRISLQAFIYSYFLAPWTGPMLGSLLFPFLLLGFWLALLLPLYRRCIYIKI